MAGTVKGTRDLSGAVCGCSHLSIPGSRFADGPPASATTACRFRAGMDACSIWQKLLHRRRIAMRSPAWLASGELPSPSCPRTCRDNSSRSIRCSTRRSMPSHLHRFTASRKNGTHGRSSSCAWAPRLRSTLGSRPASPLPALACASVYPWPPRPPGRIEGAFAELARRWKPILDAYEDAGCDICYEIHPSEDTFDERHFRDVPRRGRRAQACLHQL